MRPKGTRKYFQQRLTLPEKRKILRRLLAGVKQIEIAREFGCLPSTIREVRKAAGLKLFRELTPHLEEEIVEELRQGTGQHPTSKKFRVSYCKIRALMKKHGIHHPTGDPGMAVAKRARVLEKVLRRDDFANHIAAKEGVSSDTVLRIGHALYGAGRFRNHEEPLRLTSGEISESSLEANFKKFAVNQVRKTVSLERNVETLTKQMNGLFLTMVQKHIDLWHSGQVPADRDAFIYELLEVNLPKVFRGKGPLSAAQWDECRRMTETYIRTAVEQVIGPQSRWTN